ncbi:protein MEI2-like 4 [Impatiens glandulifera]|uniref:protein MEI2-like 4 n=1 Tax=Impatiens glandulifera TaxID=253017 RepID=UPI001FB06DCC|nr:protein MEI2-like 4 [Impatiens glandulifera]
MPSERMDSNGFSSSFFSEHVNFPNERQVGFWKSGITPADYGMKIVGAASIAANNSSIASSLPLEGQPQTYSFGQHDPRLIHSPKVGHSFEKHAVGSERAAMRRHLNLSSETRSNFNGEGNLMMGVQYESGQLSSSLSELFDRQCNYRLPQVNASYEEVEPFDSLEEIEAQTIGNLLPNDDDFLNGLTAYASQRNGEEESEDLDFFSSVGGMDLGDDEFSLGRNDSFSVVGDHSYGESPSHTLFIRNINSTVEDSELHALFEQYGVIRTLYTTCKRRGFVMISYYDIRAAENAMKALQNQPLRNRRLDIQFFIPRDNSLEGDINQGIVVVSNLDSSVSNEEIRRIFCPYGEIKEVSESSHQGQHKVIHFYDVRDAKTALNAVKNSEIAGNLIKHNNPANNSFITHGGIAPSSSMDNGTLPGSHLSIESPYSQFMDSAFRHGISSSVPNNLLKDDYIGRLSNLPKNSIPTMGHHMKFDFQKLHPHSLPEYHDGFTEMIPCNSQSMSAVDVNIRPSRLSSNPHSIKMNDTVFSSSANGGSPYMWNNSSPQTQGGMMWSNSPSVINGTHAVRPPWFNALPRAPHMMMSSVLSMNNNHNHVGSTPSVSGFNLGSVGNMRIMSAKSPHHLRLASQNMFPHVVGNSIDAAGLKSHLHHHHQPQRCFMFPGRASPQMVPMASSFESPNERIRSRRSEGSSNQIDNKKLFDLDIDRIFQGEDNRTTLMIKNIPNKYTSKMLLAAIDEHHRGTYDFLYLPIDFKNKCNVGYAFINMTDPSMIIPFYQAFNGKKWEKFNSEKVASIAYGRIQGKSALIAHFQNSSLMNEDKRCRPILFNTDGPNAGDQVPFPMGVNIRSRPTKSRAGSSEENNQEGTENLSNEHEFFNTEP